MKKTIIKDILNKDSINQIYTVSGWVRNKRGSKQISFIMLNDGTCFNDLQVVINLKPEIESVLREINTGASIEVKGQLIKSEGSGQQVELVADKIKLIGPADPDDYPIQPKKHNLEFLRKNAHLRFRTKTFSSVFRIRHGLSFAIHQFFNNLNFYYINTPIITSSDAEGAGEMFKVTTLDMLNVPLDNKGNVNYNEFFFHKKLV